KSSDKIAEAEPPADCRRRRDVTPRPGESRGPLRYCYETDVLLEVFDRGARARRQRIVSAWRDCRFAPVLGGCAVDQPDQDRKRHEQRRPDIDRRKAERGRGTGKERDQRTCVALCRNDRISNSRKRHGGGASLVDAPSCGGSPAEL